MWTSWTAGNAGTQPSGGSPTPGWPPNCDRFCHAILDRPASSHPPVVHGDRIPFGQRQTGYPRPGLRGATVTIVEGSMFCITQTSGDILPGEPQGLFVHDTRVLSRW